MSYIKIRSTIIQSLRETGGKKNLTLSIKFQDLHRGLYGVK